MRTYTALCLSCTYICMCVCMNMHIRTYCSIRLYSKPYICTFMRVCTYTCIHCCVYTLHTYVRICVYMYIHIHCSTCMHVCVCIHVHWYSVFHFCKYSGLNICTAQSIQASQDGDNRQLHYWLPIVPDCSCACVHMYVLYSCAWDGVVECMLYRLQTIACILTYILYTVYIHYGHPVIMSPVLISLMVMFIVNKIYLYTHYGHPIVCKVE